MSDRVLVWTLSFNQAGLGSIFDFLRRMIETYNLALGLNSLAFIDVKLIWARYEQIGGEF